MRDAYFQKLPREVVEAEAKQKGVSFEEMEGALEKSRERMIMAARENPYEYGFIPPVWIICKAILRGEPVSRQDKKLVKEMTGLGWEEFQEATLKALGLEHKVNELLIMGANRSGKTDYATRTATQLAMVGKKDQTIGFQILTTGRDVQMKRMWHYMPKELKARNVAQKRAISIHEHISYTEANGFANSKIVFGNGSLVKFVTYKEDVNAAMEGMEKHRIWLDEEEPISFVTAARGRVASVKGSVLLTFTPVKGYTPVVAEYMETMQVVRWHTAYMLPIDGGEPCPWLELGLEKEEYEKLSKWHNNESAENDPGVPEARPENCFKWILGGEGGELDESVKNRAFAKVPRFATCKNGEAAIIWFFGSDNPYGTPLEVIKNAAKNKNAKAEIKKRVYGLAEKAVGSVFSKFNRKKHIIKREELPKKLVRVQIIDPAPDRNWFFGYMGYEPKTRRYYVYREWPGNYEIPGVGVPGEWAVLSDKKEGVNDGAKGDAQESFGLGFDHYKFEIARLEGWKDFKEWAEGRDIMSQFPDEIEETVEEWSEADGAEEKIEKRVIDSRAASSRKTTGGDNLTLFDECARRLEGLEPASGARIEEGVSIMQDLIATDRFFVVEDCVNSIFALEHWTGKDGNKGACKDPIDFMRYGVMAGLEEYEEKDATEIGEVAKTGGAKAKNLARTRKRAGGW